MMSSRFKGALFGIIAAVAYGTNPLFSLPLYMEGLTPDSVLFYRFGIGSILLGSFLLLKGENLKIQKNEILPMLILGFLFSLSSLFLFKSFLFMDAGIASTILFVYPVLVVVIMAIFFKEKASWFTYCCIIFALTGIALLYKGGDGTTLSLIGMMLVGFSALSYAIYIIAVGRLLTHAIPSSKIAFWAMSFGTVIFVISTKFLTELQPVPFSWNGWCNVLGEAIVPTIISILCINISVKYIGATSASIIGALEPVTALIIGILVFHETFTFRIAIGALLIIAAVIFVLSENIIIASLINLKKKITSKEYF